MTEKLVGIWVFDYGEFTFQLNDGSTVKQKGNVFFIDTLHFNDKMQYHFITSSSKSDSNAYHTGNWKIEDDGQTLILYDRLIDQEPALTEEDQQLHFPLKIMRADKLRIKFSINEDRDSSQQTFNNSPIYFSRVK